MPKYDVEVELLGQDGNGFMICGLVQQALRKAGVPADEISAVNDDMMSGDYDHLLQVAMATVHVV